MTEKIVLDFGDFQISAELFDTPTALALSSVLPKEISLIYWGAEAYGTIGRDLGSDSPRSVIPPGGIAYTNRGNYLCFFFGQDPAWPVEYVGTMEESGWKRLAAEKPAVVAVRKG